MLFFLDIQGSVLHVIFLGENNGNNSILHTFILLLRYHFCELCIIMYQVTMND